MLDRMKLLAVMFMALTLSFASCTDDSTEGLLDDTDAVDTRGPEGASEGPCFTLVYPVTLVFPDGTTAQIDSREEKRTAVRDYREAGGERGRIQYEFPVEVTLADGTVQTITAADELKALFRNCRADRQDREPCFSLNFPVTVEFPDDTTVEVEDREDIHAAFKEWKENNPDAEGRPVIQLPYSVTLADGTVMEIATEEDKAALREACPKRKGPKHRRHKRRKRNG